MVKKLNTQEFLKLLDSTDDKFFVQIEKTLETYPDAPSNTIKEPESRCPVTHVLLHLLMAVVFGNTTLMVGLAQKNCWRQSDATM